jgi:hypothetical protein
MHLATTIDQADCRELKSEAVAGVTLIIYTTARAHVANQTQLQLVN